MMLWPVMFDCGRHESSVRNHELAVVPFPGVSTRTIEKSSGCLVRVKGTPAVQNEASTIQKRTQGRGGGGTRRQGQLPPAQRCSSRCDSHTLQWVAKNITVCRAARDMDANDVWKVKR